MTIEHKKKISESASVRHATSQARIESLKEENSFLKSNTSFLQKMLERAIGKKESLLAELPDGCELRELKSPPLGGYHTVVASGDTPQIVTAVTADGSSIVTKKVQFSPLLERTRELRRSQSEKIIRGIPEIQTTGIECICTSDGIMTHRDRKCKATTHSGKPRKW
jgi:hypothetical protein